MLIKSGKDALLHTAAVNVQVDYLQVTTTRYFFGGTGGITYHRDHFSSIIIVIYHQVDDMKHSDALHDRSLRTT